MEQDMNNKYFKDDNFQRAREITSPRPLSVSLGRDKQYFTPEEKKEILTRVKTIGVLRTAIEYGMNKKIIFKWLNAMNSPGNIDSYDEAMPKALPEENNDNDEVVVEEVKSNDDTNKDKTSNINDDFSTEEKAAILARVKEVGFDKAATEVGTTKSELIYWKYVLKIKPMDEQIEEQETKPSKKMPKGANDFKNLELENALLREKIQYLTEQINKLRAAIGTLR